MLLALLLAASSNTSIACAAEIRQQDQWLRQSDLPGAVLRRQRTGQVRYTLTMDANGCPRVCSVAEPKLEQRICERLVRRARIEPHPAAAGPWQRQVFGVYRWHLPELPPSGGRAARPRTPFDSWYTDADYPAAAMRSGDEGETVVRLDVDASGKVLDCQVTLSSGSTLLDSTTCVLMRRRAQVAPARTRHGRPIRSQWSHKMVWKIPASYVHKAFYQGPSCDPSACSEKLLEERLRPAPPLAYKSPLLSLPDTPPESPRKAHRKR